MPGINHTESGIELNLETQFFQKVDKQQLSSEKKIHFIIYQNFNDNKKTQFILTCTKISIKIQINVRTKAVISVF